MMTLHMINLLHPGITVIVCTCFYMACLSFPCKNMFALFMSYYIGLAAWLVIFKFALLALISASVLGFIGSAFSQCAILNINLSLNVFLYVYMCL